MFRQVNQATKQRSWPNASQVLNIDDSLLSATVQTQRRRCFNQHQPIAVAPKLIEELTSLEQVTFTRLNLTKAFRSEPSSLL